MKEALASEKVTQTLGSRSDSTGQDIGYGTHLAVYFGCSIKADHVENYGQKGA